MLYHSQGYQAQDISPRNSKWREVAGNLNGCSLEYSWGDNTAMIRQREVTGGVKQSKIGGFSTSCSDEATFWRNTIPSPFRSDPSYRSYHPISSPQSNKKQHSVNRCEYQRYRHLTRPVYNSILYGSPQPRTHFARSSSKAISYQRANSSTPTPAVQNHRVFVFGQEFDISKECSL